MNPVKKEKTFEVRDMRHKEKFYMDDLYLNGYAKLCGIYATGVYLSLCRHANKDQTAWPSIRKISEELAVSEKQVGRSLKVLENHRIISRERMGKKLNNRYVLIDKSEWTTSPINTDYQSDHIRTTSPIHSKDTHIKESHSKELAEQSSAVRKDQGIVEILNAFKPVNPSYAKWFGNTTQRAACTRLIQTHGLNAVLRAVAVLPRTNGEPFLPTITTPLQLEDKWAALVAGMRKTKQKVEEEKPQVIKIK